MHAILSSGPNDNYVSITLLDSERAAGGKAKKVTRTMEASGGNPKWQDGKGETLIFHGIQLQSITLLVRFRYTLLGSPGCLALRCACVFSCTMTTMCLNRSRA